MLVPVRLTRALPKLAWIALVHAEHGFAMTAR